ncbi:YciI family protein [Paucibacter sp. AS339]|uniref:YciI family protein n=1 Tax=Paucibacter hankyongi TaxID=3133434 RepID=UPI0030A15FE9
MPRLPLLKVLTLCLAAAVVPVFAQQALPAQPAFDADLAQSVGADDYGMRKYVLVVLKTGPKPMPAGPARDAMFKGHFANINRLAAEGKLALAGPFDGVDGWRGLFILAVSDIEEAKQLAATDPVISSGEMVAEFHKYYGSAALMLVNPAHAKVAKKSF